MIKVIGNAPPSPEYEPGTLNEFLDWFKLQGRYQLDVETNVTDYVRERRLKTIQFGEYSTDPFAEKTQWVILWADLTDKEKILVFTCLNDDSKKKYIHNASFEYQTFLIYNLVIENVYDTMLVEKIIYTGHNNYNDDENNRFFSLAGTVKRRLGLSMSKEMQTTFGDEGPIQPEQIIYAATDVMPLDIIAEQQKQAIEYHQLQAIVDLENEACLAFAEIEYNGMKLDREAWMNNLHEVEPIITRYKDELEAFLREDPRLNKRALEKGFIEKEDRVDINWNSPIQKRELFELAFPHINGATKAILRKYLNSKDIPLEEVEILYPIVHEGNYELLQSYLLKHKKQELLDREFLIPKGHIGINWNSQQQVLPLFTAIHPKLNSLDEQSLAGVSHPVIKSFQAYKSAVKLNTSYGERFIVNHVQPDGKVRTRFNQILETGRVSSAKPRMLGRSSVSY